jgi:hypothetical protein
MKKAFFFILLIEVLIFQYNFGQSGPRNVIAIDDGWRFYQGDPQDANSPDFDDRQWRMIDLPHDWSIEGTVDEKAPAGGAGGYLPTGTGWYRKHFKATRSDLKMHNLILFDGVYMNSDLWLNGKHLGNYPFGYNSFWYNLKGLLKEGDNLIAVRVDNSKQPGSRWYSGSGIYRHVWLVRTNPLHVAQWGIFVTTPEITEKNARVTAKISIENASSSTQNATVISSITDVLGVTSGETESVIQVQPGQEQAIEQTINLASPVLWSVDKPVIYSLITKIIVNDKLADIVSTPFGVRSIVYDEDKGFLLNGKSLKMNGVCLHHDGGCVGAAVPVKVWERRLQALKDMGCNAIRTSHNPVAPEFLDLCDRMGFLVMNEIFDEWKMVGTESVSNGGLRDGYSFGSDPASLNPNYTTRMIRPEQLWKFVSVNPYVIGDFMWTGIDYLGEAFWPSKHASSGVIDLCGFTKDGYYFYQSQWTRNPMLHLFPHWNWEGMEGKVIPVLAYTNCDAVELFVNGKSYGEKRMEFPRQGNSGSWLKYDLPQKFATTADLHLSWDVPYEPGVVKAVGKKDGKVVCTEIIETTGNPSLIRLTVDRKEIKADNQDVAHVIIEITDLKGNIVPTADNMIFYEINGNGKLIGLDNGNPTDHEPYKSGKRKVFNGKALAIIQAGKIPGKITLTASSEGMNDTIIEIMVSK